MLHAEKDAECEARKQASVELLERQEQDEKCRMHFSSRLSELEKERDEAMAQGQQNLKEATNRGRKARLLHVLHCLVLSIHNCTP